MFTIMAVILNYCVNDQSYTFESYSIEFRDLQNIHLDTKIVMLLHVKAIWMYLVFMVAIFNFGFLSP